MDDEIECVIYVLEFVGIPIGLTSEYVCEGVLYM